MDKEDDVPMLMRLLFGEAAERAQRGASERLRRWAGAFEEWMGERRRNFQPNASKQARLAWQRLLRQQPKMPWELEPSDIEGHARWMQAEGYAASTTANALGVISNFYRWCSERGIDPECEAGFNPAAAARRPKVERYAEAKLLSEGEVRRLLGVLQRDKSPVGQRDYAFTLARLRLGASLSSLQRLTWGQIELDEAGAWVRWRAEGERARLPGEAWEAIQAYLRGSGRLSGMREEAYLFPPLAYPGKEETGYQAEDWREERYISSSQLLLSLKLYGRLAKIPEEKLTLMALRRTAMRLRLRAGASVGEMQTFLDSQEEARMMKYRLGKLPELPGEAGQGEAGEEEGVELPERKAKPFKPGEGVTHGYYAHSQPAEEIEAVLREKIEGIEEEIVGLRMLERGMMERQRREGNVQARLKLWKAYNLMAYRLAEMIRAEEGLANEREESEWADKWEEAMAKMGLRIEAEESEPELRGDSRRLREEIAGLRYTLRNVFRWAMEAIEAQETIRLAEIYSSGCLRLVQMLRMEKARHGLRDEEVREQILEALREANKGWKITQG